MLPLRHPTPTPPKPSGGSLPPGYDNLEYLDRPELDDEEPPTERSPVFPVLPTLEWEDGEESGVKPSFQRLTEQAKQTAAG